MCPEVADQGFGFIATCQLLVFARVPASILLDSFHFVAFDTRSDLDRKTLEVNISDVRTTCLCAHAREPFL